MQYQSTSIAKESGGRKRIKETKRTKKKQNKNKKKTKQKTTTSFFYPLTATATKQTNKKKQKTKKQQISLQIRGGHQQCQDAKTHKKTSKTPNNNKKKKKKKKRKIDLDGISRRSPRVFIYLHLGCPKPPITRTNMHEPAPDPQCFPRPLRSRARDRHCQESTGALGHVEHRLNHAVRAGHGSDNLRGTAKSGTPEPRVGARLG
jgi:hypothetical protein